MLAQHIGLVVTHRTLLQQVWGPGSAQQTHYLRVYMKQLRAKLEPDPSRPHWLLTETGVGYRLAQRESAPAGRSMSRRRARHLPSAWLGGRRP